MTKNLDEPTVPTETDAAIAGALLRALPLTQAFGNLLLVVGDRNIRISATMVAALIEAAKLIAEGHMIDVVAAEEEISLVQALAPTQARGNLSLKVGDRNIRIPATMVAALIEAAKLIAEGHAIDVVAADEEISAQEAADILKVSRPYLLNLVKKGILPCRMVDAHHRIPIGALNAYKRHQALRRRSIEALSAETQDLGH
jgi:excisionase family DNA binding protein